MRDVPVVAGRARNRDAGLSALLREGGCRSGGVHGAERTAKDARDGLPEVGEVGEAVIFGACQQFTIFGILLA